MPDNILTIASTSHQTESSAFAYEELITKALNRNPDIDVNKLLACYAALTDAGASLSENKYTYELLSSSADCADQLLFIFAVIKEVGILFPNQADFYDALIYTADNACKISKDIVALKDVGALFPECKKLYEGAIFNSTASGKLALGFAALEEAGASLLQNKKLYKLVIYYSESADKFSLAFSILKNAGAILPQYQNLYKTIILNPDCIDNLSTSIAFSNEIGATLSANPALFKYIIASSYHIDRIKAAFLGLRDAGAILSEHQALYMAVVAKANCINKLPECFAALKEVGATLPQYYSIYEALIDKIENIEKLADSFVLLDEAGIALSTHSAIYHLVIINNIDAQYLAVVLAGLKKVGAKLPIHQEIYLYSIKNASAADKLTAIYNLLLDIGATPDSHLIFYARILSNINNEVLNHLEKLKAHGYCVEDDMPMIDRLWSLRQFNDLFDWFERCKLNKINQRTLYELFLSSDASLIHSPYLMIKIMNKMTNYLLSNSLCLPDEDGYARQCEQILSIVSDFLQSEISLTQGPINKSEASYTLEKILNRLGMEPVDIIQLHYDDALGYLLNFGDEPDIYLNGLLKQVNFNHIELTNDQVMRLGDRISEYYPKFYQVPTNTVNNLIVNQLPIAAQHAMALYISTQYMNMNRLFRGVLKNPDPYYAWSDLLDKHTDLIVNFLTGCLVNWSAAQLPRVLIDSQERQILDRVILHQSGMEFSLKSTEEAYVGLLESSYQMGVISQEEYTRVATLFPQLSILYPSYALVDRGENFENSKQNGEMSASKRRLANPFFMPSVTSFSVFNEGSPYFHNTDTTRTKLETSCAMRPIMNTGEGELLIPSGTVFIYTEDISGRLIAREINSPGIEPPGGHWSTTALAEAYRHHLRIAYQEADHRLSINNQIVERPNHGLAHTHRVMLFIDIVIDYFAHHARDQAFKRYCQEVTRDECEWVRVAAAYSITGRESELAASEAPRHYDLYREKSMAYLKVFLNRYPASNPDKAMYERILHVVRWMGNPGYETDINHHEDNNERDRRNFIQRILTLAHKLDLPRCYRPRQFDDAMAMCRSLSVINQSQKADYLRMIRYAIALIRAHGSSLFTDLSFDGTLVSCAERYREPFEKVSTNLRQLWECSDTVTRPKIEEKYQFANGVTDKRSIGFFNDSIKPDQLSAHPSCSSSDMTIS